jgi:hypothetical protein
MIPFTSTSNRENPKRRDSTVHQSVRDCVRRESISLQNSDTFEDYVDKTITPTTHIILKIRSLSQLDQIDLAYIITLPKESLLELVMEYNSIIKYNNNYMTLNGN